MAIDTEVTDDRLTPLLHAFDLGRLRSCKAIAEGPERSASLLQISWPDGS